MAQETPQDPARLARGLWEQMASSLRLAGGVVEAREQEERSQKSNLELRIDGLAKFKDIVAKEKATYLERFKGFMSTASAAVVTEAETTFWARIAELDSSLERVSSHSRKIACV